MSDKLLKLENIFKILEDSVGKKEFIEAFKQVVALVKRVEAENITMRNNIDTSLKKSISVLEKDSSSLMVHFQKTLKQSLSSELNRLQKDQNNTLNFLRDKVDNLKDGRDADEEEMIERLRAMIPEIPEIPEKFDAAEIVENIQILEERIKELDEKIILNKHRGGGGQLTDRALQYAMGRMVKQETPSGTINGSTTDFTVPSTIHAVLSFELNSRVVSLGTYSITGSKRQTIAFDTAPASVYSGKSFVVTYI